MFTSKSNNFGTKKEIAGHKPLARSMKVIKFAHEATGGQLVINLNDLTLPASMVGFQQSSPSLFVQLGLSQSEFRHQFKLVSRIRGGQLYDYYDYEWIDNSQIRLKIEPAQEGEIFLGYVDFAPRTHTLAVDAEPMSIAGTLLEDETDFVLPRDFTINAYPSKQIGEYFIMRGEAGNMQPMFRCSSNDFNNDGDFIEVGTSGGRSNLIRFRNAGGAGGENIAGHFIGAFIHRPSNSHQLLMDKLAGDIDLMKQDLATEFGYDVSRWNGVTNLDLALFGQRVLVNENKISNLESIHTSDNSIIIDLTGSGGFISGTIKIVRVNNQVTISVESLPTHASLVTVSSAASLIPDWARPTNDKSNVYRASASEVFDMATTTTGILTMTYRNYSGVGSARTDSTIYGNLTYNV
jgi:hypothetical protein